MLDHPQKLFGHLYLLIRFHSHPCSMMSHGNPYIVGSKGQSHKTQTHYQFGSLHSCECWLFLVLNGSYLPVLPSCHFSRWQFSL